MKAVGVPLPAELAMLSIPALLLAVLVVIGR